MAWYLLSHSSEAVLPMEVWKTEASIVLTSTLTEISSERYDRAQWLWCTKILHLNETGTYNLWDSMEHIFLEHLPGLVHLPTLMSSMCSSSLCPQPYLTQETTLSSLLVHNPRHIDQQDVNDSLIPGACPCTECVDDLTVQEHGLDSFRHEAVTDVDTGESSAWYACKGHCTWDHLQFSMLPYLLILNCLVSWHSSQGPI